MLVIAPANTRGFSRTERDRQKILALWQDGFFAGRRAAEAVRDFWTRETPSAGDTGIAADRRPSFSGRRFPLGGSWFCTRKSVLLFAFYHIFTQILQNLRNPLSSVPLCIYNVGAQYT